MLLNDKVAKNVSECKCTILPIFCLIFSLLNSLHDIINILPNILIVALAIIDKTWHEGDNCQKVVYDRE
jgi:hypothetical protein